MKKIIFLLAVIPITLNAQLTSICDSSPNYGKHPFHSASTIMDFSSEAPLVIDTFFHNDDTSVPIDITETDFLASVAYLNQTYNQFNIFFKYRGFNSDSEAIENMLNIYATDDLEGGSAFGGVARVTYLAFINEDNRFFIIAHEVGHLLGLAHPTSGGNTSGTFMTPLNCNGDNIAEGNFAVTSSGSERVTRDPNDPNFNADVAGDLVVDTPAHYPNVNLCINTSTTPPTLEYLFSNEVIDFVGVPYENIDVNNIMDIDTRVEFFEFKDNFTDGQGVRMRETIENDPDLQTWLTPVSSLYEPYQGSYYFAGPTQPDHRSLFQPGFDYTFISAGGQTPSGEYQIFNTPSDYEDINFIFDTGNILNEVDRFSLDLENIYHPNRSAIVIEQIEDQPRRCYHNVNRGASNGKVIKFNDNIPNHNYTVTVKDSMSINQPTLIQDLGSGLYIIEKNYNDGTKEQKVILKGNNNE